MKNTKKLMLTILAIILTITMLSSNASAWDDCPFGYEDEPYPGSCWRYVDTNNDGICDHSQSQPSTSEGLNSEIQSQDSNSQTQNKFPIIVILSFIIVIILVILTQFLKKIGKISNMKEKILWNILLLIFFIPSGITGIILVFMPVVPALREISINFIQLHDITSFFFFWISGYHIIWHTRYYTKCAKELFKK